MTRFQVANHWPFSLNGCEIQNLSIVPELIGSAGKFCDKQKILEVMKYNEGCGCYSYDSRRINAVIDHTINIDHHSLSEIMHISNFSSSMFSLLYQTAVFSSQVCTTALDLTDDFFDLKDAVQNVFDMINETGGFIVTGWYKRGNVKDRTILHQNNNSENAQKFGSNGSNDDNDKVDNSTITYHPCTSSLQM